jgi:predicted AlkP superfamily pyrophosphatase or phosphodiesterase
MRKRYLSLLLFLFFSFCSIAQYPRPKLLVGIVVDQMQPDYLNRFNAQLSENGFKRLLKDGFNCRNAHINYIPTITGPGHASIFSGTSPRYHGIVANEWYDRALGTEVYCVADSGEQIVGASTATAGVSPRQLLATNLADELKIYSNQQCKVISLSLKDRAAVLPGGHMPDGAFWLDQESGNFVTSTFYMSRLPDWVEQFNQKRLADFYLNQTWTLLLPADQYPTSLSDDNPYETLFKGKDKPVFPYSLKDLSALNSPRYAMVYKTPFGNSLLADLAIETLQKTNIGHGTYTDFLTISFSGTDAVGHAFGPRSLELNDTYCRLDRDIARLLDALDKYVGKGNYTLFLTADHGVNENPDYLKNRNIPAGYLTVEKIRDSLAVYLNRKLGPGNWIESIAGEQIYLNQKLIAAANRNLDEIQRISVDYLTTINGIAHVYTSYELEKFEYSERLAFMLRNGFYYNRSGDIKVYNESGMDWRFGFNMLSWYRLCI